jgi:branched-chain amino acid transport system substrate-binding protein
MLLTGLLGCEKKKPIKIGFVGGLTGPFDELGINGRNGVILAVEEANNAGGISGHPIKLICKDDQQNETRALNVDQELINEGVIAIIGHMTSTMSVKVLPLINKTKILMISPTTSKLSCQDDYFIRLLPYNETNRPLAQYAYHKLNLRKLTIVYDLSNIEFSQLIRDDITKEFE